MDENKKSQAMKQRGHKNKSGENESAPVPQLNMINNIKNDSQLKYEARQDISKALNVFDRVASKVNTSVESMTPQMVTEAQSDTHFREAIQTRQVNMNGQKGVSTGNVAVFPEKNSQGKNRYTVADTTSGLPIYEQLFLSECATAIMKLLNRGNSKYCPEIKQLLEYEQKYVKHYRDALSFKKKAQSSGRDSILETRFQEAKHQALTIKEELQSYCRKI